MPLGIIIVIIIIVCVSQEGRGTGPTARVRPPCGNSLSAFHSLLVEILLGQERGRSTETRPVDVINSFSVITPADDPLPFGHARHMSRPGEQDCSATSSCVADLRFARPHFTEKERMDEKKRRTNSCNRSPAFRVSRDRSR